MSLADEIRRLETLLQRGELTSNEFEGRIADLIRMASASTDTSQTDLEPAARLGSMTGGPTPTHIGAYELVELLGQGGMGAVYLAKHILKPGLFAVKVPRYELLTQPGFGHRFKREASVGLRLDHAGIVRVHDLVIDGDWAAIVMDFVAGPNLETLLRNQGGPLPLDRILDLMVQTLDAMEYAHGQGVVHRDLKPKNLIVRPSGQLQVTDFGIARLMGTDDDHTGTTAGTAAYMAPELYGNGEGADHRADIYALGMTLYKLLAGHIPFQREMEAWRALQARQGARIPAPPTVADHLPAPLVAVIRRALAPAPTDRFASCAEFREALIEASGGDWEPRAWVPPPTLAPPPERSGAGLTQYAILTVLVALLAAVIWLAASVREGPPEGGSTVTEDVSGTARPGQRVKVVRIDKAPQGTSIKPTQGADPTPQHPSPTPGARPTPATGAGTTPEPAVPTPAATISPAPPAPTPLPVSMDPKIATPDGDVDPAPTTPPEEPLLGLLFLSCRPRCLVQIEDRTYSSDHSRKGLLFPPGRYKVRFVCDDPACDGFDRRAGIKTLHVAAGQDTRYVADFYSINGRE